MKSSPGGFRGGARDECGSANGKCPTMWLCLTGKLAECWDANTGLRASCPNLQPKNDWAKVRHDFQFLAYCVEYTSFFKQKMHDRFRLLAMKLPLQKRSEAKEILLVPTLSPNADYPKVWPFPTKSLATQEKTGESALQGSSRGL